MIRPPFGLSELAFLVDVKKVKEEDKPEKSQRANCEFLNKLENFTKIQKASIQK